MNKTELIAAMAEKTGVSKADCTKTLSAALEAIAETLSQGDKVQLAGFGTFEVRERKARTGRNPKTGETVEIAAAKVPAFKAGKALKDSVES